MNVSRIVAIDFGTKRCGIAETDDLQIIASPLTTVARKEIIPFLKQYLDQHKVEVIVVGDPRRWDDSETHATAPANDFCKELQKNFPEVNIEREDEAFTSKMAMQSMLMGGVKKKQRRDKSMLDKISAALILQSFLKRRDLNP